MAFEFGEIVIINSEGSCKGMKGIIKGDWKQQGYKNCYKVQVSNGLNSSVICVKESNLIKIDNIKENVSFLSNYDDEFLDRLELENKIVDKLKLSSKKRKKLSKILRKYRIERRQQK